MTIGPPWRKPVLVRDDLVLRQVVDLVEVVVGVEVRLLPVVIGAAVEAVGARAGRELHLHRAWPGAGAGHRAGDRDFLDRVEARRDHREEAVGRLQHVAGLHAVDGDVDGVVRQAVDAGGARAARRIRTARPAACSARRARCARPSGTSFSCSATSVEATVGDWLCTSSERELTWTVSLSAPSSIVALTLAAVPVTMRTSLMTAVLKLCSVTVTV